jgi:peroxiredoxin
VQPYAISRDSPYTHVAWTQALDLDFPLLSDWNADATQGFGVAFELRGLRDVSQRSAFLIGTDGVVRGAWLYDRGDLPDFDALLEAARAMA